MMKCVSKRRGLFSVRNKLTALKIQAFCFKNCSSARYGGEPEEVGGRRPEMKMPGPAPAPGSLPSSRVEKRELRAAGQWFSKQVPSGSIHLSPRASYKSKPLTPTQTCTGGARRAGSARASWVRSPHGPGQSQRAPKGTGLASADPGVEGMCGSVCGVPTLVGSVHRTLWVTVHGTPPLCLNGKTKPLGHSVTCLRSRSQQVHWLTGSGSGPSPGPGAPVRSWPPD